MATAQDVLNLARSQLGVAENPLGSNSGTPYHAWYGSESQGWQWCAIFVDWVFHHIDPALVHGLKSAYSGDFLTVGSRHGEEVPAPIPGAIAIMDYGDGGITDHIGIVEAVSGGYMALIEGNHNNRVERVTRAINGSTRFWYILPKYSNPKQEDDDMGISMSDYGVTVDRYSSFTKGKPIYVDIMNCGGAPLAARILMTPATGGQQILVEGSIANIAPDKHLAVDVAKHFNLPPNLAFDLKVESVNGQPMKIKYTE
jgi:hypothetical protein